MASKFLIPLLLLAGGLAAAKEAGKCEALTPQVSSPDSQRSASLEICGDRSKSHTVLVISGEHGRQPARFPVQFRRTIGDCVPKQGLEWLDNEHVAAGCDYQPTLSDFVVIEVSTGRVDREYAGMWFRPSPDGKTVARVGIDQRYETPEGARCCLTFNEQAVYPAGCQFQGLEASKSGDKAKSFLGDEYTGIHTFLTEPVWSPDGQAVAFVEKVFDFHYDDPYNRDFYGRVSGLKYYLAIVGKDGSVRGYALQRAGKQPTLAWLDQGRIKLNGEVFDLRGQPPAAIP